MSQIKSFVTFWLQTIEKSQYIFRSGVSAILDIKVNSIYREN
jgi:glycopeptide antibiotics resistance protein